MNTVAVAFDCEQGYTTAQVNFQPLSVERMEWGGVQKVSSENTDNVSAKAHVLNIYRCTLQRKLGKKPSRN